MQEVSFQSLPPLPHHPSPSHPTHPSSHRFSSFHQDTMVPLLHIREGEVLQEQVDCPVFQ